jgi:hypothetical protein
VSRSKHLKTVTEFSIFLNLNHSSKTNASLVGVIVVAKRANNACRLDNGRHEFACSIGAEGAFGEQIPHACCRMGWWTMSGVMDCTANARLNICAIARKQPASVSTSHSLKNLLDVGA